MFFVPIISPPFFSGRCWCRKELQRFLEREERLGGADLIFPVYYVECLLLQDETEREKDPLAKVIAGRQLAREWLDLKDEDFSLPLVRRAMATLAKRICDKLRPMLAAGQRPEAPL